MSKCLKCGAALPPVGECPACAVASARPASAAVSGLLARDIHIDRRRTPERTPAVPGPAAVPSFADLALEPAVPTLEHPPAPPTMAPPPPAPAAAPRMQAPPPSQGLRPTPPPVHVVTFAPPARSPPPPPAEYEEEALTPRQPMPVLAPAPDAEVEASATTVLPRSQPPAAMPRAAAGPGAQEIHARPAALWRRLLSFTIDAASICGVAAIYISVASSVAGVKGPAAPGLTVLDSLASWLHALQSVLLPGVLLMGVLATAYCAVAAFLWKGRTLGRVVLGLRLVDTQGMAPPPGRAIARALLSVVSFGLFLGGFWMALFDRHGQTLHDKLTSTFVVQPS